jgi:SH3-like domain-containing protein
MSIQVKSGQIRSTPSFLGGIVGLVSYGDQVSVLQRQVGWVQVKTAKGAQGWIHESALTDKRIVLNAGGANAQVGASGKEIALAGKGFNSQTEARFRSTHSNADFASVDKMESIKVTPQQMQSFLESGAIKPSQGVVR